MSSCVNRAMKDDLRCSWKINTNRGKKQIVDSDTKTDINNLTAYQEDHRIEAKTAKTQIPNSIWESYSSFANTEGGFFLLDA